MKIKGIFLNWITVKDFDAAIKFYTEVMGLTVRTINPEYGWAELSGPDGALLGIGKESPLMEVKAGSNSVITISVDDIQKASNELKKNGTRLVGDLMEIPDHVKLQTFVDPDGNMLQLVEEIEKS